MATMQKGETIEGFPTEPLNGMWTLVRGSGHEDRVRFGIRVRADTIVIHGSVGGDVAEKTLTTTSVVAVGTDGVYAAADFDGEMDCFRFEHAEGE